MAEAQQNTTVSILIIVNSVRSTKPQEARLHLTIQPEV